MSSSKYKIPKQPSILRLKAALQQYDWGKRGDDSLVAHLAPNSIGSSFSLDKHASYAEVWMGTHPNGPNHLFKTPNKTLLDTISGNPSHYLGSAVLKRWPSSRQVPFLFKILSISKALPLQAHPDKALARKLNARNSTTFVDANHKPEIAVAIGEPLTSSGGWGDGVAFTGFVGFRPLKEICGFLQNVPELESAVGSRQLVEDFIVNPSKESLQAVFGSLISRGANQPDIIREDVESLVSQLNAGDGETQLDEELIKVILTTNRQYPGDVGVFATSFFMNLVKLKNGEAVYIGADEIHAYLEGDIIECMAVSDNVLNAAFTDSSEAKEQFPTFLSMLTYTSRSASHWALYHHPSEHSIRHLTQLYAPPLEEFVVMGTYLTESENEETLQKIDGPTIGIITKGKVRVAVDGESMELDPGGVVYVVPNREVTVELLSGKSGEVWWAATMV